jgi:hypothetical protein
MRRVAYLTDVEGRWDKLADFCAGNAIVRLDEAQRLRVADGGLFVFGGDAIDRGPAGRKVVATLLAAKHAQPDRVVLLAGNRDINKLRLARELDGHPPSRVRALSPAGESPSRPDLLRAIFAHTMGARDAFEHRRTELIAEGGPGGDEDVVDSYLEDLSPGGPLRAYLAAAVLAHREDETLFLHGGVTAENLGVVPGRPQRAERVDAWVSALNEFYTESMDAFVFERCAADGTPLWSELIRYQAPLRGTHANQTSVVYARPADQHGNPSLPPEPVIAALRASEIRRVVLGHTPSGDCPALLRDGAGFELVLADNSYGRLEQGSRVTIDAGGVCLEGTTLLDSGDREPVLSRLTSRSASVLGLRDAATGRLVKGQLARGDYLTYRGHEAYRVEQIAMTDAELRNRELVVPA